MRKLFLLIPLMFLLSCSSFTKLKMEIQNLDDAIVERVTDEIESILEKEADRIVEKAIQEARDRKGDLEKVDNKFIKKTYERLEPILDSAYEDIEPIVRRAAREIQAQVREEILEELTGEEINEACPDCKKDSVKVKPAESVEDKKAVESEKAEDTAEPVEEGPEVAPDKTVPDNTAEIDSTKVDTSEVKVETAESDTVEADTTGVAQTEPKDEDTEK